jgi:hypothetical protein
MLAACLRVMVEATCWPLMLSDEGGPIIVTGPKTLAGGTRLRPPSKGARMAGVSVLVARRDRVCSGRCTGGRCPGPGTGFQDGASGGGCAASGCRVGRLGSRHPPLVSGTGDRPCQAPVNGFSFRNRG